MNFALNSTRAPAASLVRIGLLAVCVASLAGCSTIKGWFGDKDDKDSDPAKLVEFTPPPRPSLNCGPPMPARAKTCSARASGQW